MPFYLERWRYVSGLNNRMIGNSATMDPDQPIDATSEIFAVAKQDDMDRILH